MATVKKMSAKSKAGLKKSAKKNAAAHGKVSAAEEKRKAAFIKSKKLVHYSLNRYGPAPKKKGAKATWTITLDKKTLKYVMKAVGKAGAGAAAADPKKAKLVAARAAAKDARVALAGEREKQKGVMEKVRITAKGKLEKLRAATKAKLGKATTVAAKKKIRSEHKKAAAAITADKNKALSAPRKAIFEKRIAVWKARVAIAKLTGKEAPAKPTLNRAKKVAATPAPAADVKPPKQPRQPRKPKTPAAPATPVRRPRTPR